MQPIDLNWILFIGLFILFGYIGFTTKRESSGVHDYFHDPSLKKNVVSLVATNLTLGTGLVYLVTGAHANGPLMILVPIAIVAGYAIQAKLIGKIDSLEIREDKNIIAGLNRRLSEAIGARSILSPVISGSLVVIFVMVMAFEIFASTMVMLPFLTKDQSVQMQVAVSIGIYVVTVVYTILGGIKAVFRVDVIQVPLILLMMPVLLYVSIPGDFDVAAIVKSMGSSQALNSTVYLGVAIACINAIATQLYSLLNWGAVSHVAAVNQQRLLMWVGAITGCFVMVFVVIGLMYPMTNNADAWSALVTQYQSIASQSTPLAYIICGILVLGMGCILLTTIDAIVITSIMFWYDNVLNKDSKSNDPMVADLKKLRMIGAFVVSLSFTILLLLNYFQPNPFYALLSMAGGVSVYAPLLAVIILSLGRPDILKRFNNRLISGYFFLFLVSGIVNIILMTLKSGYVSYVGITAFICSAILSIFVATAPQRTTSANP